MPNEPRFGAQKIRLALTGCGRISANHFASLEKFRDHVEIVAVCDSNPAALNKAVLHTGAEGYLSHDELIERASPDIVVLATPSGLHASQTIAAARKGIHVLTEKPMATRWRDGLEMVKVCDEMGVRLFVVKQNRYNSTLQLLKSAISKGRFGRIYSVSINVFWSRPQQYYDSAKWRGTWEFDGGAFMNQASHYVDLLDWLVGPVESVMAFTGTLARNIEVEDSGVAIIRWRNGALGTVNVSMLAYPKNFEGSITILGEKGTVRIGGVAVNEIQHWEFEDKDAEDGKLTDVSYQVPSVYGYGHIAYYRNVINTLKGSAEASTDGREGLRSLEILVAIYKSATDACRTDLPLESGL